MSNNSGQLLITIAIAGVFILLGALDMVAEVISMFFMVTYGSLCLISFLNHFAADPSYRPRFRSKWYISLFGAIACFGVMFFMNPLYAALAAIMMVGLYFGISYYNPEKRSLAAIFQGVIFQISRKLQVFLQKAEKEKVISWRPSAYPEDSLEEESTRLLLLIDAGQLPISFNNINIISKPNDRSLKAVIVEKSQDADLTIVGMREEIIRHKGGDALLELNEIGNTLFVHSGEHKQIK